jgi:hypothetical protein
LILAKWIETEVMSISCTGRLPRATGVSASVATPLQGQDAHQRRLHPMEQKLDALQKQIAAIDVET